MYKPTFNRKSCASVVKGRDCNLACQEGLGPAPSATCSSRQQSKGVHMHINMHTQVHMLMPGGGCTKCHLQHQQTNNTRVCMHINVHMHMQEHMPGGSWGLSYALSKPAAAAAAAASKRKVGTSKCVNMGVQSDVHEKGNTRCVQTIPAVLDSGNMACALQPCLGK